MQRPDTDLSEATYVCDSPRSLLAAQICALARQGEDVFCASFNDTDPHLYVTVGTRQAAQLVRTLAPEAIITIID